MAEDGAPERTGGKGRRTQSHPTPDLAESAPNCADSKPSLDNAGQRLVEDASSLAGSLALGLDRASCGRSRPRKVDPRPKDAKAGRSGHGSRLRSVRPDSGGSDTIG